MPRIFHLLSLVLAMSCSAMLHAAPGDLDATFSGDGIQTTAVGTPHDEARSVVQQSDGKLVAAGSSFNGSDYDFALVRYNSDGSLDTTFDGDGKLTTAIGSSNDYANSVIQQADSKLVVTGYSYNGSNYDFALVRYNSDGSLDTTFNSTGKLTTAIGSFDDVAISVIQQADGKLVVAGYSDKGVYLSPNNDFALVRYNSDGSLDTTFSGDGKLTTAIGSGYDGGASVIQQADGKLVVAGSSFSGSNYDFALVRYNIDGSLDTTFSGDGKLTTAIGSGDDGGASVIQQADGSKLVLAGYSNNGSNNDFALVRYNTDGTLDTTFNSTGKLTTVIGSGDDVGRSVIQQADGKLVLAGYSNNGSNNDFALALYNSDGSLDTAFSGDGKQTTAVGSASDIGYSVIQQVDGQLVLAGSSNNGADNDFALVRYTTDAVAPTVPSGLSATVVSAVQINLSWTASSDILGVVAYKIYRGGILLTTLGNVTSYSNTGLTPSTSYSYTVSACDTAGNCSAQSSAVTATTPADAIAPTVPTGLSALAANLTQINLSWSSSTDVSGITAYKIYRGGTLLTTLGNVTNYSNAGLTPSTSYSYTVAACDAAGNCSAQSSEATATTLADTTAPTVPSGLSVPSRMYACSPGCNAQLDLYWTASTDNIGVTAYKIYRDGVLRATVGNVTGYQDTFLPLSATYSYTVAACDAAGNCSAQSSAVIATTPNPADTTAPTVPGGLSATAVSTTQINLNWSASTDAVGVTMYKIYRGDGTLLAILGNVTNYSHTGLTPSTSYSYIVSACDAAGNCSALTYSATATTLADATAPTVPGGLSATAASATQINLSWSASTDASGVTAYKIYRDGILLTTLGNVTSFSNTGLTPSTNYSYTVSACDVVGNCSAQSAAATATTLADTTAPTVPGGLSATAVSATQINLNWTASTDAVGVTAYKVYRGGTLLTTLGNVTSYSNTGLTASTNYSYTVAACDAAGNCSAESSAAAVTTLAPPDTTAPTVPGGLSATAISATQITLNWTASTDAVGVTAYKVYRGGLLRATVGKVTSYGDKGLMASTSYIYTVAACDAVGNCSAQSSSATATTKAPDGDNDGVPDASDNCPLIDNASQTNTDGDSLGDVCDTDDDNDGKLDVSDNCPLASNATQTDTDGDSMGDACDTDDDNDGKLDASDNCPLVSNAAQTNTDGDGMGDACDTDDDNDDVPDTSDAFPLNATESVDTDGDGVGNNADTDDDNDGWSDISESGCGTSGLSNTSVPTDADSDLSCDVVDPDDDNDSVVDVSDNCPLIVNTNQLDWDGDGIGDRCDDPVPLPGDIAGMLSKDKAGTSVAFAGDFNGDGYGDYIIGIPGFDLSSKIKDAGRAEVISGKDGTVLVFLNGTAVKDALGTAVAGGADIDNDGFDDVAIGAPNAGATHAGSVTVLYGPDGTRNEVVNGTVAKSAFGAAFALGDVNGDNRADILVGAPKDDDVANGLVDAGSVTVYSGNGLGMLATPFYGATAKANAGSSVASGDVNNDGNADIIIGAPNDSGVGSMKAYTLAGIVLLQKTGATTKAQFGKSVATGDVNDEGYADVLVGAPLDDNTGAALKDTGSITVFSGNGGAQLMKQYGGTAKAGLGNSLAAGDVNGDGYADIIAGAWKDNNPSLPKAIKDSGSVSVWSGNGFAPITTLYGLVAKDYFGFSVSAGDINSDGKADIIIGIPGYDAQGVIKPVKDAGKVTVQSGAGL